MTNVVHVEKMYGSSIQQNTRGSVVKINFRTQDPGVREIVDELKELAGKLHLPEQADQQLRSDVATLEAQLRAPHPKPNIITECLYSLRTIVEIAVADMLAVEAAPHLPALLEKISRLLS